MQYRLTFKFERETKNTGRFKECEADGSPAFSPKLDTVYLAKSAMPNGKIPQMLTLIVELPS